MNSRNKSVRRRRKPVAGAASSPAGAPNFLPIPGAPDIRCATRVEAWCRTRPSLWSAAIAQLVEHVIRNDGVGGSSPSCGTSKIKPLAKPAAYNNTVESYGVTRGVTAAPEDGRTRRKRARPCDSKDRMVVDTEPDRCLSTGSRHR